MRAGLEDAVARCFASYVFQMWLPIADHGWVGEPKGGRSEPGLVDPKRASVH